VRFSCGSEHEDPLWDRHHLTPQAFSAQLLEWTKGVDYYFLELCLLIRGGLPKSNILQSNKQCNGVDTSYTNSEFIPKSYCESHRTAVLSHNFRNNTNVLLHGLVQSHAVY
jgi:hypothetical protein